MLTAYFNALRRGDDDEDVINDFRVDLRIHRPGLFSNIRRPTWPTFVLTARPRVIYFGVYPFLLGVAIIAVIAIGPLEAGKKEHTATTQNPAVAVVAALTVSQRSELTKLGVELRRSRTPEDRRLGEQITEVLRAVPGAAAAVVSFSHTANSVAEKAIELVLGAVSSAALSGNVGVTFNVDNSHVNNSRVSGPDFTFDAGTRSNGPAGPQASADCVTYLVKLDQLVDDDRNVASQLPGRSFPLDAGARACKLTSPLNEGSGIVRQLAKR